MFVSRKTFGALTVAALAVATSAFAASAVLQPLDYTDAMATLRGASIHRRFCT